MFKNWKNRILDHEETPPKSVWDSISDKLDADEAAHVPEFVSRLNAFEKKPPLAAWGNIESELDSENVQAPLVSKAKVVPLYRKLAVAATVLVIVGLVFFLTNKKESAASETVVKNIPEVNHIPVPVIDKTADTTTPVVTTATRNNLLINNRDLKTKLARHIENNNSLEPIAYTKAAVVPLTNDPFANSHDKIRNADGNIVIDVDKLGAPNTYIMASLGPNGESVRVSSKLKDYISYLSDKSPDTEEYLDKIIKGSGEWKARIRQWSEKLINNNVSPSFNNFLDVFQLSNLLEENK